MRPVEIEHEQRTVAARCKGIEADMVEAPSHNGGEPFLPEGKRVVISNMKNAWQALHSRARLLNSCPRRRGLGIPAHRQKTNESRQGSKKRVTERKWSQWRKEKTRGPGATPAGHHCCYLRTVRSMAAAIGFPLLGFLSPFGSRAFELRVCIPRRREWTNCYTAASRLPTGISWVGRWSSSRSSCRPPATCGAPLRPTPCRAVRSSMCGRRHIRARRLYDGRGP